MPANKYSQMSRPKSRGGRTRISEGMSKEGKSNFRHKIVVRFDFTDYDLSINKATEAVRQANYEMRRAQKQLNTLDKGFGIYIDYRQVTEKVVNSFKGGKGGVAIMGFELPQNAERISSELGRSAAQEIGRLGSDIMRKYVNRIDTGLMKSSITYMQRRRGNNKVDIEIGWIRTWHKYFGWQEDGTRPGPENGRGIKPMRSLARTYMELQPKAQAITSKFFTKQFLQKGSR